MARCLIVGKYYFPFEGGIENNTRVVAEFLAQDHHVHVVAFSHDRSSGKHHVSGVDVHRCRTLFTFKSQPVSLSAAKKILSASCDIIHFHAPNVWSSLFVLIKFKLSRNKPKLVVTHHMDIYGRPLLRHLARQIYDWLLAHADLVIVTSMKNAEVSSDLRIPCNLTAIPLGIDVSQYVATPEVSARADALREARGGRPIVSFVGRHARYKGLDVLLRALALLDDVHAIVAGDGPSRPSLQALAAELGIADRVSFLGKVSHEEKLAVLMAGDVFAFPSTEITEAFGISQLEAMAMGTPVVASNLPTGVTDVAVDRVTAVLVETGNAASLAEGIQLVLTDEALAKSISTEARRRVDSVFNHVEVTRRAAEAVTDLLATGRPQA